MIHMQIKIGRIGGGGSDYSAFVQHIGIPSIDISMGSGLSYVS
jgi:N-acetylated-alpha-linked acidic dipeptidase